MKKFRIKLKEVHESTGKSAYRVWKDTGVSANTVRKYTDEIVIVDYLPNTVLVLADYYQVDWRDPKIIEVIEDDENPEIKRPELLASTA